MSRDVKAIEEINKMRSRESEMDHRLVGILSESIRNYISFISRFHKLSGGYKSTKGIDHYGFIPANTKEVSKTLIGLYNHVRGDGYNMGECKFLDIGCGIGNIVLLACHIGFNAYGLEYNKEIYNIARSLIVGSARIFKGNMSTFKKYGEYDVLYYYVPIADGREMEKFAKKLTKAMKVGAYVIPRGHAITFDRPKEFERIKLGPKHGCHLPIFRKIEV